MQYILFNSVTLATRIRNYFRFSGEQVSMVRTPAEISSGGCSYSIVVPSYLTEEVYKAAREYGIAVKGVFEKTANGFTEVKT